jgi:DnaK suppressor protein
MGREHAATLAGASTRTPHPKGPYPGGVYEDADELLAEREARLEAELAELTKPPSELGTISFGKRIGEGTSMAVDRLTAVSTQENLLATLDEVRRARRRIVEGTYGTCEICGEPIPRARLEARPWANRCIAHS